MYIKEVLSPACVYMYVSIFVLKDQWEMFTIFFHFQKYYVFEDFFLSFWQVRKEVLCSNVSFNFSETSGVRLVMSFLVCARFWVQSPADIRKVLNINVKNSLKKIKTFSYYYCWNVKKSYPVQHRLHNISFLFYVVPEYKTCICHTTTLIASSYTGNI